MDTVEAILVFIMVSTSLMMLLLLGIEDITQPDKFAFKTRTSSSDWSSQFMQQPSNPPNPAQIVPTHTKHALLNKCFGSDCDTIPIYSQHDPSKSTFYVSPNDYPLKYHSKTTYFLRNDIGYKWYGQPKGFGLMATNDIKAPVPTQSSNP